MCCDDNIRVGVLSVLSLVRSPFTARGLKQEVSEMEVVIFTAAVVMVCCARAKGERSRCRSRSEHDIGDVTPEV